MKLKDISWSWYFLITIIIIYAVLSIFNKQIFFNILKFFKDIIIKIIPIFLLIFVLMVLSDYFITSDFIIKHLKTRGLKKWMFAVAGGILSSGPIYMWYPLLADLKYKGLNHGLIACFLYNRAVKLPLLPLAVIYFGWIYIIVLTTIMVFASIFQGILINKLMEVKK